MSLTITLYGDGDNEELSGSANDVIEANIDEKAAEFVKYVKAGRGYVLKDGLTRRVVLEWRLDADTVERARRIGQKGWTPEEPFA